MAQLFKTKTGQDGKTKGKKKKVFHRVADHRYPREKKDITIEFRVPAEREKKSGNGREEEEERSFPLEREKGKKPVTVLYSFVLRAGFKNERTWERIKGKAKVIPVATPVAIARLIN